MKPKSISISIKTDIDFKIRLDSIIRFCKYRQLLASVEHMQYGNPSPLIESETADRLSPSLFFSVYSLLRVFLCKHVLMCERPGGTSILGVVRNANMESFRHKATSTRLIASRSLWSSSLRVTT